jgi:hypothetical protein
MSGPCSNKRRGKSGRFPRSNPNRNEKGAPPTLVAILVALSPALVAVNVIGRALPHQARGLAALDYSLASLSVFGAGIKGRRPAF